VGGVPLAKPRKTRQSKPRKSSFFSSPFFLLFIRAPPP
jgi:hypothetical protein